ncbi:MAG: hypothetical protein KI785_05125 [Devosiaceae bacterium]|nr:hypothetical protein [Devosiaceae bacterium MH13]
MVEQGTPTTTFIVDDTATSVADDQTTRQLQALALRRDQLEWQQRRLSDAGPDAKKAGDTALMEARLELLAEVAKQPVRSSTHLALKLDIVTMELLNAHKGGHVSLNSGLEQLLTVIRSEAWQLLD